MGSNYVCLRAASENRSDAVRVDLRFSVGRIVDIFAPKRKYLSVNQLMGGEKTRNR